MLYGCICDRKRQTSTKVIYPNYCKSQKIFYTFVVFWGRLVVRAVLKISANPTFEDVCTCHSIYSTWDAYITLTSTRSANKLFRMFYEKTFFYAINPDFMKNMCICLGKFAYRGCNESTFLVKFMYSEKSTKT